MITSILKFEISNSFAEWEKAFYNHQPIARKAGIFALYHGHEPDNEQKICVVMNVLSEEHMQNFMETHGASIAASGHILETTISELYVN
ncbi:MAG: hypothetical protein CBC12_02915 [Candidatus Puniceispirillum sp. TMED52]|nr:hypothetical protein [SAR116 cluster bacterium]OUU53207.1 MAG: hypothetical protein CBC12_02915 [Candidatus Puniceispirillum sp. TMED52]HCP17907.1 hypothetical protein [Alphaproteobacteria bacterium]